MKEYSEIVKGRLFVLIAEISKSPELFVKNPRKDFTRDRKLPFETVVKLLISMGGSSIYNELLETQGYDVKTATASAFVQQRDKILPFAFEFLLNRFTYSHTNIKTYRGYRLLATDSSDLQIATDPKDLDTYFQNNQNEKGYNLLHLNAMYDLCNRLYIDAIVQPRRFLNESMALVDMVDRSPIRDRVIVIADRGYESYNNFAHIENKGWKYLIRVKDLGSTGILSGLSLPTEDEFDICVTRILTRKQTNEVKAHPKIYRYLSRSTPFDYLDPITNKFYPMSFWVVRFKIADDSYETVITNLNPSEFLPKELKDQQTVGYRNIFQRIKIFYRSY